MIKEAAANNGTPYRNYVCSNSISGCKFFWRVFFDNEDEIAEQYHEQMDRFFKPKEKTKDVTFSKFDIKSRYGYFFRTSTMSKGRRN